MPKVNVAAEDGREILFTVKLLLLRLRLPFVQTIPVAVLLQVNASNKDQEPPTPLNVIGNGIVLPLDLIILVVPLVLAKVVAFEIVAENVIPVPTLALLLRV